jgi:hypothetical protein
LGDRSENTGARIMNLVTYDVIDDKEHIFGI